MVRNIRISDDTHSNLIILKGKKTVESGVCATFDSVISELRKIYEEKSKNKKDAEAPEQDF